MNKILIALLAIAFSGSTLAHDSDTPVCDQLDNRTSNVEIDGDFNFDDDEIRLRNDDGEEVMVITEDRELIYKGKQLALTPRGQELVDEYYDTFEDAMDDFTDLAGEAAHLGVDAALTVVTALFSGDMDEQEIETEIEARARNVTRAADRACGKLADIEAIELEMAEEIDGFEPVLFKH